VSVIGRGSSSAGQPKGELAALGQPLAVAFASPEVGDGGWWAWWSKRAGRLADRRGSGPRDEKEAGPGRWRFGPAGDGPKLKKKFLLNFKLNLGIWLDFENLHKEI
jgi:hypothetical protein